MPNLSDRIKELRNSANMTQDEFGQKFGVVKSTISLYESGKSTPNDEIKRKICEYFNVTLDYLDGRSDRKEGGNGFFFFFFDDSLKDVFTSRLKTVMENKKLAEDTFLELVPIEDKKRLKSYLNGDCEPTLEDLIEISHALDVSIDYLLGQITEQDDKCLRNFRLLSDENKDIIIGDIRRYLKEQRHEASVAADEPLKQAK